MSCSQKFWQGIIDEYYSKYCGIKDWHETLVHTAQREGKLEIPSGRHFPIIPDYRKRDPWPITIIKNYPVQGFGADLVMLARLEARKRLKMSGIEYKLISTIHDSIVLDTPKENLEIAAKILSDSISMIPELCKVVFDYPFSLPLTSEIQYGPNKKEMLDWKT